MKFDPELYEQGRQFNVIKQLWLDYALHYFIATVNYSQSKKQQGK
jgi:hypothetical protein